MGKEFTETLIEAYNKYKDYPPSESPIPIPEIKAYLKKFEGIELE